MRISSLLLLLGMFFQQPTPLEDQPDTLAEPIKVICPEVIPDNRRAIIRVETAGKGVTVLAFRAGSGLDTDVSGDALDARAEANTYGFTHDPGVYRIVAYAIVDDQVVTDDTELRVGEDAPLPLKPVEPMNPVEPVEPPPSIFDDGLKVIGPTGPITEPQQVTLNVIGLADSELPQASINVTPTIDYMPVKTWTGETVIVTQVTSTTKPGKYTFTVSLNEWRVEVEEGLLAAQTARISQGLIDEYAAVAKKIANEYQHKSAVCVIEVAGGPFPPPVDPDDPDLPLPPDSKVTKVVYVYEKDTKNTPRQVAAALQRINADGSGIVATEFEEDTTDGDGQVPDQYKVALEAARKAGLPALVVQSGDTVLRVVKDPTTEAAVLEAAK